MHASILSLEALGLVQRHASNQRVVLLQLTTPGRKRLETATRRVREVEHAALADLSARTSEPYERGSPTWQP
jgi:DNA-binding MarR family transcriptional regulator